ncbi:hypothetical protein ACWX0K_10980 [Nitrobacteraceae bacterium UC4446_H13]
MSMRQDYEKASFASGEISPELSAATDLRLYQTGVAVQENMVTMLEGIMTRRPGTRFVVELKNEAQRGKLWPFRYASGDYYMLLFNGGKMRVLRDEGIIQSGGAPYEVTVPWTEAHLATLRSAPTGARGALTVTSEGSRVQLITRIAADQWTVGEYLTDNGPVDTPNVDQAKLIASSAVSGAITLIGTGEPFSAGWVGGVMRLEEANASLTALWTASEVIKSPSVALPASSGQVGDLADLPNLVTGDGEDTYASTGAVDEFYGGLSWDVAQPVAKISVNLSKLVAANPVLTVDLYGKNGSAPASGVDGVLLGTTLVVLSASWTSAVDKQQSVTVYSTAGGSFEYVWLRVRSDTTTSFRAWGMVAYGRGSGPVILRRWGDNIYEAATDGSAGSVPPTHDSGDASYGGVVWRFRSRIYGFVRITSVTDSNHAAGTVLDRLPDSALLLASHRWSPPAWGDGLGWPTIVQQHQQRLMFFRINRYWGTRQPTINDFLVTPDPDSSLSGALSSPDGSLVEIMWTSASAIVVLGAADMEWMLRAPASSDVLQAKTTNPIPDSQEGSKAQVAVKVDRGVTFFGRNGRSLHYLTFNALTQQLDPEEISAHARHIFCAPAVASAWQKRPHKVLWLVLADGSLVGCTIMRAQKILAFHRHPMTNAFVEDIASIPAIDDGRDDVYLIVRRTINGATRRYVELLQPFFTPRAPAAPTAEGAWFVDCGLKYSGAPVSTISGLDHLEGQTVAVHADGAMQRPKVVADGAIALDAAASEVVVGLPQTWRVRDLPRALQIPGGTSRGKRQRANTVIVDVLDAASGRVRLTYPGPDERNADGDDTPFDDLIETGMDDYGEAVDLFTGRIEMGVTGDSASDVVTELVGDDAMPLTLRAIVPDIIVEGD